MRSFSLAGALAGTAVLMAQVVTPAPAGAASTPQTRPAVPASQPAEAAAIELTDANGRSLRPLELGQAKAAVLVFVSTQCPISNGYAPEINRIIAAYEAKGIRFYLVHSDPDVTAADALAHAKEYGYTCPILMDGQHRLVDQVQPRVTPEAVIVGAGAKVLYRGRIDDKWLDYGRSRSIPSTHDLRDALDAVISGAAVVNKGVKGVGCPI